jgi:hypothetical protein
MSNAGQAVLTVVGTAVGFVVGGPAGAAWGFQLGSLAGQTLFPTDLGTVSGPRLNEANVQVSTIGAPIAVLFGTYPFSGNLIWSSGIQEKVTKKKQGGKGGPTQTVKTYSYSVSCAVGICEGEINEVLRIWADSKLIYDLSPQREDETEAEYEERLATSGALLGQMQVYRGTEDQMPDPTIESYEGAGNVAGFRGLAYVVFTNFQLEDYGNRIPNFRFEALRCFDNSTSVALRTKPASETRAAADGRSADADLTFTTEPQQLYWTPGVITFRQENAGGAPGYALAYESTGGVSLVNSKDMRWGSYEPEGSSGFGATQQYRKLDQFSDQYAVAVYGADNDNVNLFYVDSVFKSGASAGDFSIKWGIGDLGAAGDSSLRAGSWFSVRPLYSYRGWGSASRTTDSALIGTSVQKDSQLKFQVDAGSTYFVRGTLFLRATAAADIKVGVQIDGAVDRAAGAIAASSFAANPTSVGPLINDFGGVFAIGNVQGLSARGIAGAGTGVDYENYQSTLEFTLLFQTGAEGGVNECCVVAGQNTLSDLANPSMILEGSSIVWRKLNASINDDVQYVVKQTNEERSTSLPLADDAELFLDVEAGQLVWIDAVVVCYNRYDYDHDTKVALDFTGDAEEFSVVWDNVYTTYQTSWSQLYTGTRHGAAALGVEISVEANVDTSNSSLRGAARFRGYMKVGATGGRLSIKWRKSTNGFGGGSFKSIVFAGSFLMVHDLQIPLEQGSCSVTLGNIVEDIALRCGLTTAQLDTSDLTETVDGYLISQVTNGRSAIEPLRSFGWFDCVESAGVLRWPTRGKAAVANLSVDDMAAHPSGEGRPPIVSIDRQQTVELPRRLRVHYAQTDKNAEPGEQSASRLSAGANEVRDLEVPIRMSNQKAAQIADVLLYESWVARTGYKFSLDHTNLVLEPADAVTIPVDGRIERVRITSIEHLLPGLLQVDAVRDDDGVFVSYAEGNLPAFSDSSSGSGISTPGVAELIILDIPLLQDSDNDAGYYAVVNAQGGTTWGGALIFRSPDGGITYSQVGTAAFEGTTGTLLEALPVGPTTVIDEGNALVIDSDETFESIADASLLAGLNAAAIGDEGRWEIIQFRDAEYIDSPPSWRLTGLLRGRRGTEWAMGLSQVGDKFVLLDEALVRIASDSTFIGTSRPHKAVLSGVTLEAAPITDFTPAAVALEPFSPIDARGERDLYGNLTISWKRRGRIGQELRSGVEVPLSEATEAYEIDVLDAGSPQTVLRTLTSSIEEVEYTIADQVADFGSPLPLAVTVRIYQLSATVGRGYPLEAEV